MSFSIPLIYPILDASFLPASGRVEYLTELGKSLADAGVTLLEFRDKTGTDAEVLECARALRQAMPAGQVSLVMDDRLDVALAAAFDGVHVDAGDLPVKVARGLMGPLAVIGTSAGGEGSVAEAIASGASYVSFGPVFPTTTKQTLATPIGIEGVRRMRAAVGPEAVLVAAAGITLETAGEILASGASAVAVAKGIFGASDPAAEFRRWMVELG